MVSYCATLASGNKQTNNKEMRKTMTINNATDYAKSVAKSIWEDTAAGHPFGYDEDRLEYGEDAELSAYDFLSDSLDVNYTIGSDMEYRSGIVYITIGGPNAYIDT